MKNLSLRIASLTLALATITGCEGIDTPPPAGDPAPQTAAQPAVKAAASPDIDAHQQALSFVPANCFVTNTTVVLPAGSGHPSPLCRLDLTCFRFSNGNFSTYSSSVFAPCP
jgi:hypothetical protein